MKTLLELTAIFENVEDGWVQARIAQLPGVITAGRTTDEAKELLVDALREYLLALGGDSGLISTPNGAREESLSLTLTG